VSIDLSAQYECRRTLFGRYVTAEQTRRVHELGLICSFYGSDEPEDGMAYVEMGIDVVLTNCLNAMIAGGFKRFRPATGECRGPEVQPTSATWELRSIRNRKSEIPFVLIAYDVKMTGCESLAAF